MKVDERLRAEVKRLWIQLENVSKLYRTEVEQRTEAETQLEKIVEAARRLIESSSANDWAVFKDVIERALAAAQPEEENRE